MRAMADDFQSTQKCNLELGKEEVFVIRAAWALKKQSPYISFINQGYFIYTYKFISLFSGEMWDYNFFQADLC